MKVTTALIEMDSATVSQVSEHLRLPRATVYYHLEDLVALDIARESGDLFSVDPNIQVMRPWPSRSFITKRNPPGDRNNIASPLTFGDKESAGNPLAPVGGENRS